MTINSLTNKVQIASGSTITITSLEIQDDDQVRITKTASNGVETVLTKTTDYTVNSTLTTVTLNTALASGETATATLNIPTTQGTDYKNTSALNSETIEDALDKLTLKGKQDAEKFDRTLQQAISDTTTLGTLPNLTSSAGKFLKRNSTNDGWSVTTLSSTAGITAVSDDASPQLGGNLDTNSFNISFDDAKGFIDSNGNELLIFQETASAVNQIDITNAATGNGPSITATGGDTNIDLTVSGKGTGALKVGEYLHVGTEIVHDGDTNNKIVLGTDTQDFQTGGSSRLDISDSGVRLGGSGARVTTVLDEDTMSSDSATALATQQSIKAYVDSFTSSATAGGVGTYALMARQNTTTYDFGDTVAGSTLRPSSLQPGTYKSATVPSGTWRCMGYAGSAVANDIASTTIWIRIA